MVVAGAAWCGVGGDGCGPEGMVMKDDEMQWKVEMVRRLSSRERAVVVRRMGRRKGVGMRMGGEVGGIDVAVEEEG